MDLRHWTSGAKIFVLTNRHAPRTFRSNLFADMIVMHMWIATCIRPRRHQYAMGLGSHPTRFCQIGWRSSGKEIPTLEAVGLCINGRASPATAYVSGIWKPFRVRLAF